jgi:hypothetical protein
VAKKILSRRRPVPFKGGVATWSSGEGGGGSTTHRGSGRGASSSPGATVAGGRWLRRVAWARARLDRGGQGLTGGPYATVAYGCVRFNFEIEFETKSNYFKILQILTDLKSTLPCPNFF